MLQLAQLILVIFQWIECMTTRFSKGEGDGKTLLASVKNQMDFFSSSEFSLSLRALFLSRFIFILFFYMCCILFCNLSIVYGLFDKIATENMCVCVYRPCVQCECNKKCTKFRIALCL